MTELNEDQLNDVAEELFERANEAEQPTSALSPVGQEEVAGEIARGQHDPIVPTHMTRQVWKQMMRMHFTIRRGTSPGCGHKLSSINVPNEKGENSIFITSDPRKNCDSCWFTYFNTNGQMTAIADECFREAGRDVLERSRGKRFVKYFLRFMSTLARFQKEAAEKGEANGVKVEGTDDGGSPVADSSIGGVAGEARNIGGISEGSDPSVSSESPFDGSTVEGLGTGLNGL